MEGTWNVFRRQWWSVLFSFQKCCEAIPPCLPRVRRKSKIRCTGKCNGTSNWSWKCLWGLIWPASYAGTSRLIISVHYVVSFVMLKGLAFCQIYVHSLLGNRVKKFFLMLIMFNIRLGCPSVSFFSENALHICIVVSEVIGRCRKCWLPSSCRQ